ncbi:carbohydrate-binding protein [bacterium]|nr:carbohydrate-binding protein [bacterium]
MSQLAAALGVAVFLDDEVKFEQCLKAFRLDAPAALLSSLPNGQIGDSGRDAHDQGQLLLMAWCAEVFWMQGIDVFSEYDDRMLAAGEYFARQNLLIDTPFIQAGTVYDIYAEWHQFDGPYSNWGFESKMITILYNAYVVRKGMSAPYLEQLFNIAPQTDASFCHLMESDSSTAVAPAPMTGPAPVASVTTLSTTNMGDATNGSSSYDSGSDTWTVSGRGTSMWYSNTPDYRFSYLAVDGDATIIAQLTSLSGGSTDDARAGLVFSSDLTDTADMEAIIVTNPSGTDPQTYSFRRGDVTHSHQGNNGSRSYGRQGSPKVPYWFKIERIGNRVNTYSSPDGISWSCGESADYAVGTTAYYGLAVSSDQTNNTATATFTDVRITGGDGGEAEQTPEAPFAIYASPGGDQVPLRWLESFEADTYKIWRATQSGGPYTLVTQQAGTSYIDTGLVPGTYYYYAVSAVNAIGESTLSTEDVLAFPDTSWYEAEDHDSQMGTRLENARDFFGGQDVGYINDGEWLRYNDITLNTGAIFKARIAGFNENVGLIEVRSGSSTGTLLGSVNGVNTGGTQAWGTVETTLTVTPGVHDIFLVFKEVVVGQGPQMNINWFDIIDPAITEYELGKLASLTYDPAIHLLTNRSGVVDWDPSGVHLSLLDGSDLSDIDFSALGITSWTTTDFDNPALVTNWDGANLSGITLHSDGDFGANDSFTGADFSNVVWGTATSTADPAKFFSGGSGATSTATAANAIDFSGADLSLITGTARTTMINNLGAFDGGTPIGPIIDPTFIANSGWDSAALIAAGWQYEVIDAYSIIQAEDYDNQYGVLIQNTSDTGGGLNLQAIDNGDWAAYYNVDFGSGADEFQARVASNNSGGNIEIRLGSPTGILIGTAIAPGTNNWQSYVTVTTSVSGASGVHDLYLVNTGGGGALFNLNWFKFNQAVVTHTLTYTAGVNGSITGSSPQVISDSGDGSSVTAVADAGYSFADWSDGNTDNPRTDTNVTNAITVSANFQAVPEKDAFAIIEAEDYDGQFGIDTQPSSEGGLNVQLIQNGDWTAYYNVDFGSSANEFQARVASYTSGGNIEIRLGGPTGILIGTAVVPTTGSWQEYVTVNTSITATSGLQNVYLVFTRSRGYLFNLNWFTFTNTYTLTYTAGANGSILGTSPQAVKSGANGTEVTAVPTAYYHFVDWSDGNTSASRTDLNVTGDITVSANFAITRTKLDNWRFIHFGTYDNTGNAADDFDADFDGIINLIEYATGTDPDSSSIASFTIQPSAGSGLEVSFNRILDHSLIYKVEGTDDLTSPIWNPVWTGTGSSAEEVIVPGSSWPSGPNYFLRLSVSVPE